MIEVINHYGKIQQDKINDFENKWGVEIPEEYRIFLMKYNGGKPFPDSFKIPAIDDASTIDYFLSIGEDPYSDFDKYIKNYKERMPKDIIPIAYDPGGNLICIGVKGENTGKIFFWDHEFEADENEPDYSNVHLIGESFNLFLDSLYEVNID